MLSAVLNVRRESLTALGKVGGKEGGLIAYSETVGDEGGNESNNEFGIKVKKLLLKFLDRLASQLKRYIVVRSVEFWKSTDGIEHS